MRVLIGPSSFAVVDRAPMERLISSGFDITNNPFKRKLTKEELLDLLTDDTLGLVAGLEPLDREVLESSSLKVISRVGVGLSNINLKAADELGIKVYYTPDGPTTAVAELSVCSMLNLIRIVHQMDSDLHKGKWNKQIGFQLEGKTVVIIGFGRIGKKVAELLQSFKVKIMVVDPYIEKNSVAYPVLPLIDALPQADIISIHSSGEEYIIGEKEFSVLKTGVYILNAARGGLVPESLLMAALDDGEIAGAWLDTFESEPYSGPLTGYDNVILTPHVGSYTVECRSQMEREAVKNLINALCVMNES